MKLTVPSNWDDKLIDGLDPALTDSVYAQSSSDEYGGGRPSLFLPTVTNAQMRSHIKKTRDAGINFNYVLNGSCFENRLFDSEFIKKFRAFMDTLCSFGVNGVTVADYLMLKIIREFYPELKVTISIFAIINNVSMAKQYEDLGVSDIIVGNPNDFDFIAKLRKEVSCNLVMFANLGCFIFCNECMLHSYSASHASQLNHPSKGFYLEHHVLRCSLEKVRNPESMLKTLYVRPEDIELYEYYGINKLKIVDRTLPTDKILELVASYARRNYEGNFLDMVNGLTIVNRSSKKIPNLFYLLSPTKINLSKLIRKVTGLRPFNIFIDNAGLNGLKKEILEKGIKCWKINCNQCGICHKYFEKAGTYYKQSQEESAESINAFLNSITSSDIFNLLSF